VQIWVGASLWNRRISYFSANSNFQKKCQAVILLSSAALFTFHHKVVTPKYGTITKRVKKRDANFVNDLWHGKRDDLDCKSITRGSGSSDIPFKCVAFDEELSAN